ncbi:MAG TPA: DUF4010 domain-containing protein [Candidatus Methylomirabilis sp.]|nr:DUF4010 domain-containing protein [Candidatus Methylomirabilis sp.]
MTTPPSIARFALLFGLSFFLGLAFEDFFGRTGTRRPGGIRTFPLLALAGGMLYLFDPTRLIPFTGGLLVLGSWLFIFYREHIRQPDERGAPNVGMMVPLLNVHAYLLGAVALALPYWVAVGTTVAAVLLLTSRAELHELARRVEMKEIVTAGQFLILTGLVLPVLPADPVTTLTRITPRQAWLALVTVSTLSYASYLAQRYLPQLGGPLWMAALGGLYSSTVTTVVLARQARQDASERMRVQAGITLATGVMYLRVLAIVAVFNLALARRLALPLSGFFLAALLICVLQSVVAHPAPGAPEQSPMSRNPLELGAAATFAVLFVVTSLVSTWVAGRFGAGGVYFLAAVIGVTDIDPFVLNLAQGGTSEMPVGALAAAIFVATSSNNLLKAVYALTFAGRRAALASVTALVVLALAGIAMAFWLAGSISP